MKPIKINDITHTWNFSNQMDLIFTTLNGLMQVAIPPDPIEEAARLAQIVEDTT